jgi:hypothetical protein
MATVSYTAADLLPGTAGPYDIVSNAARQFGTSHTRIVMKVTGTECKFEGHNGYGDGSGAAYEFSIDGAAFASATSYDSGTGVHTVYTGLSDVQRVVIARVKASVEGVSYIDRSGNVLDVTGASPSMTVVGNWETIGSTRADSNAAVVAAGGNWVPAYKPRPGGNSATYGPNITSVHVRGAYTTLAIVCLSPFAFVSVDGGEPTQYTVSSGGYYEITGLSGTHDYYVWGSAPNVSDEFLLAVGGNTLSDTISPKKKLDVFGSSTVRGNAGTSNGIAEVFRVAAYFGYTGCSHGADGDTFASLDTRIVSATSSKTYDAANDCCYVAIGRNDVYGGFNGTGQTHFNSVVTRLSGIYKRVIVRGLLPSYSGSSGEVAEFLADNNIMAGWVTSLALSNVYYVDPIALGWSGIDRSGDGVHPLDAGYYTIAQYERTAFAGVLGAEPATGTSVCTVWMI